MSILNYKKYVLCCLTKQKIKTVNLYLQIKVNNFIVLILTTGKNL